MALADLFQPGALRRGLLPGAVAVVVGGTAWFGIGPLLSGGDAPAPPPPPAPTAPPTAAPATPAETEVAAPEVHPTVLVARSEITVGVLLIADLVEWRSWEAPIDLTRVVVQDVVPLRSVLGAVATRTIDAGQPITWDGLLTPGHPGFISAALEPTMLAVTIEVDRATTAANVIYPGDRVDVIMVATPQAGGVAASRTIVHDSRVLAVGSTVLSLGRYGTVNLTQGGQVEPVPPPDGNNYTIEVSRPDAERIAVATATGRLTLAMRSIASKDIGGAPGRRPTRVEEVMPPPVEPEAPPAVRVLRGATPLTANAPGA